MVVVVVVVDEKNDGEREGGGEEGGGEEGGGEEGSLVLPTSKLIG